MYDASTKDLFLDDGQELQFLEAELSRAEEAYRNAKVALRNGQDLFEHAAQQKAMAATVFAADKDSLEIWQEAKAEAEATFSDLKEYVIEEHNAAKQLKLIKEQTLQFKKE